MERYWIILNSDTAQAWSTEWGWVDADSDAYDLFDESERETVTLPAGGFWREVGQ